VSRNLKTAASGSAPQSETDANHSHRCRNRKRMSGPGKTRAAPSWPGFPITQSHRSIVLIPRKLIGSPVPRRTNLACEPRYFVKARERVRMPRVRFHPGLPRQRLLERNVWILQAHHPVRSRLMHRVVLDSG
jgi:hypothetical protein